MIVRGSAFGYLYLMNAGVGTRRERLRQLGAPGAAVFARMGATVV